MISSHYRSNVFYFVVIIEGANVGTTFKGFLVAVVDQDSILHGTMEAGLVNPTNAIVSPVCGNTSLAHTDRIDKNSVELNWTAPADLESNATLYVRYRYNILIETPGVC